MNSIYRHKKLEIYYDNEIWVPIENYMGSTVTFFLTEEGKKENGLQNFQPCINFIVNENIRMSLDLIFRNTCCDLNKYMRGLEIIKQDIQDEICDFVYKGKNIEKAISCRQIIKKDGNDIVSVTGGCDSEVFRTFEEMIGNFLGGIYYGGIRILKPFVYHEGIDDRYLE